ncbi:MAG: hypothetical protein HUK10_12785 [Bacteroides heparinolyticus]|nr:hypothetical protein [Bacteroides heparinolyticus]
MTDKEKNIIRAFYRQELDLDAKSLDAIADARALIELLLSNKCADIKSIVFEVFTPFVLEKCDVPQFSSFEDCIKVPTLIVNSGLDGISYERMGYLLRIQKRKPVADKKYGENHMKTAALMGLCNINKDFMTYKAYESSLTRIFSELTDEQKLKVEPKLCLRIPLVQNYFFMGGYNKVLDDMLSILTESTKIRRRTNCNTLIEKVNHAIDYDI